MKNFILVLLVISNFAFAADKKTKKAKPAQPVTADSHNEDSIFGSSQAPAPPANVTPTPAAAAETNTQDAKGLDLSKGFQDAFSDESKNNPLQIGGLYYQRLSVAGKNGVSTSETPISAPLQFDLFLDARPSDRVRGFIDERILYDSTLDAYSRPSKGSGSGSQQYSSGSSAPGGFTSTTTTPVPNNPQTVLDQAWLKFDINRKVFVTVGKQHLKWGVSRFWNPTDFLNTQVRDPLLPYDLRLGTTMLKLDMPLEEQKMNIYAVSLLDNPQPASTVGQLGEAVRIEKVFGKTEIGIDAVTRGGVTPMYGADFSAPMGPFDVYAEASYLTASHHPIYKANKTLVTGDEITTAFSEHTANGPIYQVSGGLNYSFSWMESRLATVGVEYFYNDVGYDNVDAYPALLFSGHFQPFYTGRNYASFYITAEGPDAGKHTSYTFSTLANLSDSSYISRVDFSWKFLTYLTFGAFVDGHYGRKGGEFNFALNTPAVTYQTNPVPAVSFPETIFDIGADLRLAF